MARFVTWIRISGCALFRGSNKVLLIVHTQMQYLFGSQDAINIFKILFHISGCEFFRTKKLLSNTHSVAVVVWSQGAIDMVQMEQQHVDPAAARRQLKQYRQYYHPPKRIANDEELEGAHAL